MDFTNKINYLLSVVSATWAISPYRPTITPPLITIRYIGELGHKLWYQNYPYLLPLKKKFIVIYHLATYLVLF